MPKKNIYTAIKGMDTSPHDSSIHQNIYTVLGLRKKKKKRNDKIRKDMKKRVDKVKGE